MTIGLRYLILKMCNIAMDNWNNNPQLRTWNLSPGNDPITCYLYLIDVVRLDCIFNVLAGGSKKINIVYNIITIRN